MLQHKNSFVYFYFSSPFSLYPGSFPQAYARKADFVSLYLLGWRLTCLSCTLVRLSFFPTLSNEMPCKLAVTDIRVPRHVHWKKNICCCGMWAHALSAIIQYFWGLIEGNKHKENYSSVICKYVMYVQRINLGNQRLKIGICNDFVALLSGCGS